jgi:hypothetical protein
MMSWAISSLSLIVYLPGATVFSGSSGTQLDTARKDLQSNRRRLSA